MAAHRPVAGRPLRLTIDVDWESLIDEPGVASLLPGEYARFARPVREGLIHFLRGLRPQQQLAVLHDQAQLGARATTAERLGALARSCPVLHKLGQTLARDHRLAAELRQHLRPLESLPPGTPLSVLAQQLVDQLGPLESLGVYLASQPLAEASVAVVVPFTYGPGRRLRGVFKILKPGIEERLAQELRLLQDVGHYLDERCHQLGIPELDYRDAFEQVSSKLLQEIRLEQEQRNLSLADRLYADDPDVHVPWLLEFCTPRITAMERIDGVKVSDHCPDTEADRRKLAELVFRTVLVRPLVARGEAAIFHCDPHPGNVLLTEDGRIALLDWSLAAWLEEEERAAIVQILLAALLLDGEKANWLLRRLSHRGRPVGGRLRSVIETRFGEIRRGRLPGFAWLVSLLDDATQQARLRPSSEMMLFRKSLLTLDGTVGDVDRQFDPDAALFRCFIRCFVAEAPRRWLQPFGARSLPTRISNADLVEAMLSSPLAAARFWLAEWKAAADAAS
ncbi:MAG: hypothetical protein DCC67_01625 [Planctomycetota bacterium]|nr:MAG: hypothetical protein DCC67_01625 [Planctomycetota bacterium]